MTDGASSVAASANLATYDAEGARRYPAGAAHLARASTRKLYRALVSEVVEHAKRHCAQPRVLDLGAGEGSSTLAWLELGLRVTAVDISRAQLDQLERKCAGYGDRLEVRCEDIHATLERLSGECPASERASAEFDIVCMNSLLHHVPDYLELVRGALARLRPGGQVFTFHDPLRYDTAGWSNRMFDVAGYMSWRVFQGDLWGGFKRKLRRARGVYLDDCEQDNAEYHVTRNGVDQDAITSLLRSAGYEARVIRYFSTQGALVQPMGELLRRANYFAVIARKDPT